MVEHASCCESPEVVTADDSSSVCAKCGVVIADCILVGGADAGYLESAAHRSEGRTNTATGTTGYNRLTYKHTAPVTGTKLQDSLTNILHGLHLPQLLKGQTMAHFNVAIKGLDIPPGSKAKPCLAVCLYIAMQQSKIIKSMSELLYQFNITLDQFSGIFYKVKHILAIPIPAMDIAVYLPRLCQAVYPDDSTKQDLSTLSSAVLLYVLQSCWLHVVAELRLFLLLYSSHMRLSRVEERPSRISIWCYHRRMQHSAGENKTVGMQTIYNRLCPETSLLFSH
ncbi:hypothetical protein BASA83_012411 [Batrachochytrium salamandrivorans]|nr:hypothetical protein BASA83_012411 [Batrachochytrium salamandrivorans]